MEVLIILSLGVWSLHYLTTQPYQTSYQTAYELVAFSPSWWILVLFICLGLVLIPFAGIAIIRSWLDKTNHE